MIKKVFGWFGGSSEKGTSAKKTGGIFGKVTPETMCELDLDKMDRNAIKDHLAMLYKRHNHAAGSLNPELREEAEKMLDAIAYCRDKNTWTDRVRRNRSHHLLFVGHLNPDFAAFTDPLVR